MLTKLFAALLTGLLSLGAIFPQLLPTQNAAAPTPAPQTTQAELTAQQAEAIALADAQLKPEEVTLRQTRLDRDDGVTHWEVEFIHGDWEYDYHIHAQTGAILERSKDYEPKKQAATSEKPAATEPPAEQITAEKAKSIALAHAGLKADQVTRLRAEKDRDDGLWVFDVEFRYGGFAYEYEIHAQTGKILSFEKDD